MRPALVALATAVATAAALTGNVAYAMEPGGTTPAPALTVASTDRDAALVVPGGKVTYEVTAVNTTDGPLTVIDITGSILSSAWATAEPIDLTRVAGPVVGTGCTVGAELAPLGRDGDTYHCTFTLTLASAEPAVFGDEILVTAEGEGAERYTGTAAETTPVVAATSAAGASPLPDPSPGVRGSGTPDPRDTLPGTGGSTGIALAGGALLVAAARHRNRRSSGPFGQH